MVKFSQEQKKEAVISLCTNEASAASLAEKRGIRRETLYKWKKQLLSEEGQITVEQLRQKPLPDDKDELEMELESLKRQVYRLQLELDILQKAAEVVKKDQGIDLRKMTNREKTIVIDALREKYPLNELLAVVAISKSSYFYQKKALSRPDKYVSLRKEVRDVFGKNKCVYGYRRVHAVLRKNGITCSEKVVRRLMLEEHLVVQGKKRRSYSSYLGEISPAVPNLLERDFHVEKPNEKWLTDLTEFHIPAGKVYLSPVVDCFDGMAVSWTIGTSPDAELVNTMLDGAIACLSPGEHPVIHTDRGCHYRWPGWIARMETAGLTRSMSRKGCSPDNAACEGFFGTLKSEMFYTRSWEGVSLEEFIYELDGFLRWYNEERIKIFRRYEPDRISTKSWPSRVVKSKKTSAPPTGKLRMDWAGWA
jgi:putative transposase